MNVPNKKSKKTFSQSRTARGGYTIVELVFYVALFAILSITVINALIIMTKSLKETGVQQELTDSGAIMERMSREIRQATSIISVSATDLKINTTDNSGTAETAEFSLSGSNLQLTENSTLVGNLNPAKINVTALTFSQITTASGQAVKIFLTVKATDDLQGRSVNFYDTVTLRGTY